MKSKVFALLLFCAVLFNGYIFAQEPAASLEDKIISSTFKVLAKAFVLTTDIDKLKRENIAKLAKMDDEKFQMRYSKVYALAKDLPQSLKSRYKFTENMSKEQAIKDIKLLDKDRIYEIIDLVPDKIIADEFRLRLRYRKQKVPNENLIAQIHSYWDDLMKKLNLSTPQSSQH